MRLFGYTKDDIINKNVNILMPDIFALNHDYYLKRAIKNQKLEYFKSTRNLIALHN